MPAHGEKRPTMKQISTDTFPASPFLSCEPDKFVIVDRAEMAALLMGKAEPWLQLSVGDGNVLDSSPLKAHQASATVVEIQCETGLVRLDLGSESARKVTDDGTEYIYCGGLDEANDGLGWMPVA